MRFKCRNWLDDRLAFVGSGNAVSLEKTLSSIDGGVFSSRVFHACLGDADDGSNQRDKSGQ